MGVRILRWNALAIYIKVMKCNFKSQVCVPGVTFPPDSTRGVRYEGSMPVAMRSGDAAWGGN